MLSEPPNGARVSAVARFLRPRSVAIIGVSARPGSAGQTVLRSLAVNKYQGDIHLVGRASTPLDGRRVLTSPDELPLGVDLAVFTLPAVAVHDALAACARREVRTAMIFASGFAESGNRELQDKLTAVGRESGLAIVGPNCIGYTNNVDGIELHMLFAREAGRAGEATEPSIAFIGQSGGILSHLQRAAVPRGMPVSYVISTGNEAGLDTSDFIEFLSDDRATRVIAVYAENIRSPGRFIAACEKARQVGKPVLLLHPGRGLRAKHAAQSHTGALVGDYASMRLHAEAAGVLMVTTMDEMLDLSAILVRFPTPPTLGAGFLTASGAYVALANDLADDLSLNIPELSDETHQALKCVLPSFGNYGNPLDVTAGISPESLSAATEAMLSDPNVGSLFISYPINTAITAQAFATGVSRQKKPVIFVALGDTSPLVPEAEGILRESNIVLSRSSDRMFKALALYHRYGKQLARGFVVPEPFADLPEIGHGAQPEWLGKRILAAAGIRVPEGELAQTADEAVAGASRVGYPVALKAQSARLAHKTEAGGVRLNLANDGDVRAAWDAITRSVSHAAPDVVLDGILVERMSPRGLELVVGGKRDPLWGPVLIVGLGGIWVEAIGDIKLLPCNADEQQVEHALRDLRSAKLLTGFRSSPPVDLKAIVAAVMAIGRLMQTVPSIAEIDVNPLMAHSEGEGVTALDALIIATKNSGGIK